MAAARITERFAFSGGKVNREGTTPYVEGVVICGFTSQNKRDYLPGAWAGDRVKRYEGRPVYVNHATERTAESKLGWFEQVKVGDAGKPVGRFCINPKHPMAEQVLWAAEHKPDFYGMSHVADCDVSRSNGREVIEEVLSVASIDLVAEPATVRGFFESVGMSSHTSDAHAHSESAHQKTPAGHPAHASSAYAHFAAGEAARHADAGNHIAAAAAHKHAAAHHGNAAAAHRKADGKDSFSDLHHEKARVSHEKAAKSLLGESKGGGGSKKALREASQMSPLHSHHAHALSSGAHSTTSYDLSSHPAASHSAAAHQASSAARDHAEAGNSHAAAMSHIRAAVHHENAAAAHKTHGSHLEAASQQHREAAAAHEHAAKSHLGGSSESANRGTGMKFSEWVAKLGEADAAAVKPLLTEDADTAIAADTGPTLADGIDALAHAVIDDPELDALAKKKKLSVILAAGAKLTGESKTDDGKAIREALEICRKVGFKGYDADDLDAISAMPADRREAIARKLMGSGGTSAGKGEEKPTSRTREGIVTPTKKTESAPVPTDGKAFAQLIRESN